MILVLEKTGGNLVLIAILEPVKQMAATFFAETTLSPGRRVVYRNIFFPVKQNVTTAVNRHQGSATPFSAHAAVAGIHTIAHALYREFNGATQALAVSFNRWLHMTLR